jgi:hypothetical protein
MVEVGMWCVPKKKSGPDMFSQEKGWDVNSEFNSELTNMHKILMGWRW